MTVARTARVSHSGADCLYSFAHWTIRSSFPLPELDCVAGEPDWTFAVRASSAFDSVSFAWFHQWNRPGKGPWLAIGRVSSGYVLRFFGIADFRVRTKKRLIICLHHPKTCPETIRHLLLDQVFPLVLSLFGKIAIHASAVATPVGVLAFAARGGTGKSTLGTYLSGMGWDLLTDDCLIINEADSNLTGLGVYSGVRLLDDSALSVLDGDRSISNNPISQYSVKKRLNTQNSRLVFHTGALPMKRIYFLQDEPEMGEPSISEVDTTAAFLDLLKFTFLLDVESQPMLKHMFQSVARIASQLSFRNLSYPRRYAALPEIYKLLREDLAE